VSDLFLKEGLVVFSEGRAGENRLEWHAKEPGTQPEYPIVVLVNGGSASASEIVAGALQDHHRGLLLGSETFGKGSVQTIIPLDDGSGLRLTTALYYLPSGRSIQEVRIQPDVAVEPYSEAQVAALQEGVSTEQALGEEHLKGHIAPAESKGDKGDKPEAKPEAKVAPKSEPEAAPEPEDFATQLTRDRQLSHAIDLLKSWTIFSNLKLGGQS
jgi:carboxyl-terminal processing protease